MIAAGAASHSDHGRDLVEVLAKVAEGKRRDTPLRTRESCATWLLNTASALTAKTTSRSPANWQTRCKRIYGTRKSSVTLLSRAPQKRRAIWEKLGIVPRGIDRETSEMMHRTHMGVDNDWVSLLLHGMRNALSDGWEVR